MATNRLEGSTPPAEAGKPSGEAAPAAPAKGGGDGGMKAWLPLIVTLVAMPALAYATTNYLLLPKIKASMGGGGAASAGAGGGAAPAAGEHGGKEAPASAERGESGGAEGKTREGGAAKGRSFAQLKKLLVNVAGTMGTRFLVVDVTMVSKNSSLEATVKENEAELRHVAISSLSSKTISDLEKPGAKNAIRSELTSLFNSVLGGSIVQEIFFTEFAIQ